eukprot:542981_1
MSNDKELVSSCNGQFMKCNAALKIKTILHQYNKIISDKKDKSLHNLEIETVKLMNNILGNGQYSNIQCLNDFYHIKYDHNTNEDQSQFNLFYQYLFDNDNVLNCDINYCQSVKRYYRKRGEMTHPLILSQHTKQNNNINDSYTLNLICRIHTYFIHAYETSKLTLCEITYIEKQLVKSRDNNGEDEKQANEKQSDSNKKKQSNITHLRNSKYITSDTVDIDCEKLAYILHNNNININENQLQIAFDSYRYHKQKLIDNLCHLLNTNDCDAILLKIL